MAKHMMTLTVNGDTYDLVVSDNQTLLDVIRDTIRLKGTKRGCTTGACGVCCINNEKGEAGLQTDGELDAMQKAFIEFGAVQCGFCTPGVIMSAKAIVNKYPQPTEEQINAGLAGVLCRCTGHVKVKEAIREDFQIREIAREAAKNVTVG